MDIFITVIAWIIGFYVAFILLLSIGFAAGGAANTGNPELSIISIASSMLLIYLIWTGISSLFISDEEDSPKMVSSVGVAELKNEKQLYYDTTEVDVSGIAAPSTDAKSSAADTKRASSPQIQTAIKKKEFFDNYPYLLWLFYTVVFVFYASWLFAPSKAKGQGKDLVKQKLIASMTWKEDPAGLKPWNPKWNPEVGDTSKRDK